jgi:hypothetical protein
VTLFSDVVHIPPGEEPLIIKSHHDWVFQPFAVIPYTLQQSIFKSKKIAPGTESLAQ